MLFTLLHYIIILIFIATQLRTNVSNFFSGTELSRQLDRWLGKTQSFAFGLQNSISSALAAMVK